MLLLLTQKYVAVYIITLDIDMSVNIQGKVEEYS